jgi:ubiquinone/menaquinone biosynthesis C-methylase UbiE
VEAYPVVLTDDARRAEHAKYMRAYGKAQYAMGDVRRQCAVADLDALTRGSYLDVGCGRGEMIREALRLGFVPCHGTEIVPALIDSVTVVRAEVHALPFSGKSFDVVTMFDVIEHLIPGDDEAACLELARVARRHVVVTASNLPSTMGDGDELHINRRPYDEWDSLLRAWFRRARVTRVPSRNPISETWRVTL